MIFKLPDVSHTPVAVAYTPNSILNLSESPIPLISIMDRKRHATCSDVAWFNNNQFLATLNLATETLHTYAFNPQDSSLTLLQTLNNRNGMQLYWPEQIAFANNGIYFAIANSKENMSSINIYEINPQTHFINPIPLKVIHYNDAIFHGVQFSPDSQFMVSTTMDDSGLILIYRLDYDANGALSVILSQVVKNCCFPLKPKSISFSSDGTLMIVCYSANGGNTLSSLRYGALAIYTVNKETGTISTQPVYELNDRPELAFNDAVSFSHDTLSSFIVVQSQSNDTIIFYSFDKITNQINPQFFTLKNPEAQLSFPHGLSLSSDNKYLAVSNFGDDKVTIYSLKD